MSSSGSPPSRRTLVSALVVPASPRARRMKNDRPSRQKLKHISKKEQKKKKKKSGAEVTIGSSKTSASDFTDEVRTLALSRYADSSSPKNSNDSSQKRSRLPPWLAPHDTLNDDNLLDISSSSGSGSGSKLSLGLQTTRTGDEPSKVAKTNLARLRTALLRHHTYLGDHAATATCGFTKDDVDDIMNALRVASRGDWTILAGAAEFLWLLLSVEENQFMSRGDDTAAMIELKPQNLFDYDDEGDEGMLDLSVQDDSSCSEKLSFRIFTRDTLIASAFHYADCVEARRSGVYGMVSQAVRGMGSRSSFADSWRRQLLPSAGYTPGEGTDIDHTIRSGGVEISGDGEEASDDMFKQPDGLDDGTVSDPDWAVTARMAGDIMPQESMDGFSGEGVGMFGENAARIAQATARIKRAEILADSIATNNPAFVDSSGLQVGGFSTATPTRREADTLRGLLISVSEDWRALAIRSVACLYRLRGIVRFGGGERTSEVVKAAREAVHVYAPLAQRLGMHRLKADLEELAFGLLYQRQYSATAALYEQSSDLLRDIEEFVTTTVENMLREDDVLLSQVDSIKVTSRVKQPYSLWKKMLRERRKQFAAGGERRPLSIQNVHDAVALRVILSARRLSPAEDAESIRTREALLCFYVQKLLLTHFPDVTRIKDYISYPKPNGYQSLHFTAQMFRHGADWQFEVQVRSEEMHRLAEYGVAAHWDYKLQGSTGLEGVTKASNTVNKPGAHTVKNLAEKLKNASKASLQEEEMPPGVDLDEELSAKKIALANEDEDCEGSDLDTSRDDRCSSYIEALTTARDDIMANKVFVFVSTTDSALDGKILPLSVGATVGDALREADEQYGYDFGEEAEFLCNGQTIGVNDELMNGDVVVVTGDVTGTDVLPAVDSI